MYERPLLCDRAGTIANSSPLPLGEVVAPATGEGVQVEACYQLVVWVAN